MRKKSKKGSFKTKKDRVFTESDEKYLRFNSKEIIYDRCVKGQKINQTIISIPDYKPLKRGVKYQKRTKFRRVVAIETVTEYLK